VFGLPLLALLAGQEHDISVTPETGWSHVVLHHEEEERAKKESRPAGWDLICGHPEDAEECAEHSDHAVHVPDPGTQIELRTGFLLDVLPVFALLTSDVSLRASLRLFWPVPASGHSPPNEVLLILSTIVLLI